MQKYWLPDYEKKIIGELQRQQNGSQFCDTLLQTEDISVPTHSCVLAALSPYLSQRLSAAPPPPTGQKHRLPLHTLKPQTLIKLVGLLYSGELQVNGALEKRDVLAAAHLFGLPNLVEVKKNVGKWTEGTCRSHKDGCTESGRGEIWKRDSQVQMVTEDVNRKSCVSTGTQTLEDTEFQDQQAAHSSSGPHSCSIPENITSDTSSSTFPSISDPCDGELPLDQSSDCMTSATLSLLDDSMTLHLSPSDKFNSSSLQEDNDQQNRPETSMGLANRAAGVEKRFVSANVASKSLEKMQEVMEATQTSIKVKLRRRTTKEEVWEVVNVQDAEDGSNGKSPQGDLTAVQSPPSTTPVCHIHNLGALALQPDSSSPTPAPDTSDSESVFHPDSDLVSVPLQSAGPGEEMDELTEKLLEDFMIGLNILPNLNEDSNKAQPLHLSHEGGPAASQVSKDKVPDSMCYQGYGNQNGQSSTDTAQSQPVCPDCPPAELCGACGGPIPTHNNSLGSIKINYGVKSSAEPSLSGEKQKLHLPASQRSSFPEEPNVLEFLPRTTETELDLISLADLQFPPCLSPLDSVGNNSPSSGNVTPAQSSLLGRPWLMEYPVSLEFPFSAMIQKLKKHSTSDGCKEKTCQKESEAPPASICSQPETVRRKLNRNLRCNPNVKNNDVTRERKRQSTAELNETDVQVKTNTKINLSPCSVSLSSNNVLAKERITSSLKMPPNIRGVPCQQSTITQSIRLRARAKSSHEMLKKAPNKTIAKLTSVQETPRHTTPETSSPNPASSQTVIKRKRGRPPKKLKTINFNSSNKAFPGVEKNTHNEEICQHIPAPNLEETKEAKSETRKRNRHEDVEKSPLKWGIPTDNLYAPKSDYNNNNTTRAEKRPRMVCLKKFQELIKHQTCQSKEKCEMGPSENAGNIKGGDASITEALQGSVSSESEDVDVTDGSGGHAEKTPRCRSISKDNNSTGNNGQSVIFFSLTEEEVTELAVEKEPAVGMSQDGATDSANESEVNIDEDSAPLATQLHQESNMAADQSLVLSQKSDASDLREAGFSETSSACQQDEDEVDVLVHSPNGAPVSSECNCITVEMSPDERDEEDGYNVDVTGDETDISIDA